MIITARMLRKAGACKPEVDRLVSRYGKRVDVTETWALEHAHDGINWQWAAEHLLSVSAQHTYEEATEPAWRTFEEGIESAQREFDEAEEAARRAYNEAREPARRTYDEATAPARRTYRDATAPARRAYNEAKALAFARALNA